MKEIELLSIVVPAYKQEKSIAKNIIALKKVLDQFPFKYEMIIVADGMEDKTYQNAKKVRSSSIKVVGYEQNHGKGYAVRKGALLAKGDIIGFVDAGMDIDPTGISMLLSHMIWYDADIIVGSKLHPVSQVQYPVSRKILSWEYRTFTHALFGFKIKDTQVGIKFFKSQVAKDVFSRSLVKNFAFDVEVLALAYALGYKRIYEAPVKLDFTGKSSITSGKVWPVIFHMVLDTLGIYYRLKIKQYYRRSNRSNWLEE